MTSTVVPYKGLYVLSESQEGVEETPPIRNWAFGFHTWVCKYFLPSQEGTEESALIRNPAISGHIDLHFLRWPQESIEKPTHIRKSALCPHMDLHFLSSAQEVAEGMASLKNSAFGPSWRCFSLVHNKSTQKGHLPSGTQSFVPLPIACSLCTVRGSGRDSSHQEFRLYSSLWLHIFVHHRWCKIDDSYQEFSLWSQCAPQRGKKRKLLSGNQHLFHTWVCMFSVHHKTAPFRYSAFGP